MTIIEVRGGLVEAFYSDKEESVTIIDYDRLECGEEPNYILTASTIEMAKYGLKEDLTPSQYEEVFSE